jgi:hypothetical protein
LGLRETRSSAAGLSLPPPTGRQGVGKPGIAFGEGGEDLYLVMEEGSFAAGVNVEGEGKEGICQDYCIIGEI